MLPSRSFRYEPNGTYVVLQILGTGEREVGGIIVPGGTKLTWLTARVVAIGPKCEFVGVGDTVLVAHEGIVRCAHDGAAAAVFTLEDKILARVTEKVAEGV